MDDQTLRGMFAPFQDVQDPRMARTRYHDFHDILVIALLTTISGGEGFPDMQTFAQAKRPWLETFLRLPNGIPSHDTFGRVLAMLDPDQFEQSLLAWTETMADASNGKLIALDGKTIRASVDKAGKRSAVHMVSAWCSMNRLVLGQVATDTKSNEITTMPALLKLLDLKGATVTIDAMGCQTKIAEQIIEQGGEYVLQVKANQGSLHEDVKLLFDEAIAHDFEDMSFAHHQTVDGDHGRVETRRLWCTPEVDWFVDRQRWAGLRSFACMECIREIDGARQVDRRYYISSFEGRNPQRFMEAIRGHWGIENQLHWCLDVSFGEDRCRARKGHAAQNLGRLRRMALNLLRREKTSKRGLKGKRLLAALDNDYLLTVVTGGR
jgi:predicted transposase YbfD/YdcC